VSALSTHLTELPTNYRVIGPDLISDWPGTLPHRIDQVAQGNQDKIALTDGFGSNLTYSDMISRVEAISEALQNGGIGADSRVLVFQQAASDWVCSMLAIMRIGGIYVPLDLRNPMPRLAAVAEDCEPSAVLADSTTLDDVTQLHVSTALVIDVSRVELKPSTRIPNCARPDSPAAILYTSGSTGTPKGIMVTHSGLRNEIEGYTKTWKLGAETVLQQSAFTFNHSSDQIYTGLVNGGMVYIVPWSKRGDPLEITEIVQQYSITYTKTTPSECSLWMQYGGDNLRQAAAWRLAFGGGEPLTSTVTAEFADLGLPQLRVFNSYGPTEISISSTKMEIEYCDKKTLADGRIPCGYSLPNYTTYVVDEQLKPLPAGMPGEVCIGGAGVSLGYLNNKELTSQHFVPNPFASPEHVANGWTRMYRTGDIGHLQDGGAMVFHSRMAGDTQVKIRGLRLELCDIESNIISAAGGVLREAIVTLREGDPDFLVAHVVFAPQHDIMEKEAFLEHLLSRLPIPQYMIPVVAITLDQLPLTNHSKVDRKAMKNMPLPQRARSAQEDVELTETMVQLKRVWQDVLGNKELGFDITPSTSFFLVGGNSLLVIRLQSRIRQAFNVVVRLVDLLGANTLSHMARKIEESSSVELIDWEEETAPPAIPSFLRNGPEIRADQQKTKTVLVTGGTGFLAKYLLPQLAASPDVGTIHCIAVRDRPSEGPRKLFASSKIVSHSGDLSAPLLGLSEDEFRALSSQVDVIIHMGAARSFWDNYHVLRPSNVHPTKELVKLAAPRRVSIHYISTVGVLPRETAAEDAVSAAAHVPPVDGTNGYVATRWASERILERSAASLGLPTSVYRFLPSAQQPSPKRELDEFVRFVDVSGVIPDMSGWEGRIDMIPAEQAAHWLCGSILLEQRADEIKPAAAAAAPQFSHYESSIAINVAELRTYIEQQRGDRGLEQMPGLRWIGRIKALGFDYFLTSQEATVEGSGGGEGGAKFESRR
jgi:hybrid polyketide synthase / nonribosomal peptide synthetase ACE1